MLETAILPTFYNRMTSKQPPESDHARRDHHHQHHDLRRRGQGFQYLLVDIQSFQYLLVDLRNALGALLRAALLSRYRHAWLEVTTTGSP